MSAVFIAVEGPTGVGKTTLTGRLATELGATAVFDPFDANPFLPQLLTTARRDEVLGLRVELTFFALRIAQLREVAVLLTAGTSVVADWALLKHPIFAATTLHPGDVARITTTVDVWAGSVPRPDVLIGLSAATSVIRQRVRHRGRAMEAGLTSAHLDQLAEGFDAAYALWDRPLIRLDASTFDAFRDGHVHELADEISRLLIPLELR